MADDTTVHYILVSVITVVGVLALAFACLAFRTLLVRRDFLATHEEVQYPVASPYQQRLPVVSVHYASTVGDTATAYDTRAKLRHNSGLSSTGRQTEVVAQDPPLPVSMMTLGPDMLSSSQTVLVRKTNSDLESATQNPLGATTTSCDSYTTPRRPQLRTKHEALADIAGTNLGMSMGALSRPELSLAHSVLAPAALPGGRREAEEKWRQMVITDAYVHFYLGCVATGLTTSIFLFSLAILPPGWSDDETGAAINLATEFPVQFMYTSTLLLLNVLHKWTLIGWSFHMRHIFHYLIALVWVLMMTSNITSVITSAVPPAVTMWVSMSIAAVLFLLTAGTALFTVPSECVQLRVAMGVLALAFVFKGITVPPKAQDDIVAKLQSLGYLAVWSTIIIVPLLAAFISVHWRRF
jgi:hypothetical protein